MSAPETYPVALCIRAVEMAMQDCDAAWTGPWKGCAVSAWQDARHVVSDEATDAFAVLARAGFYASLRYIKGSLEWEDECGSDVLGKANGLHAAVAPLIQHYDATRPGWRTE